MHQAIYILPGSNLHRTNVELYRRHHALGDGTGRCAACGDRHACAVRRSAGKVILASGEDPRWYDGELPTSQLATVSVRQANQRPVNSGVAVLTVAAPVAASVYAGYAVGDDSRRAVIATETYER